MACYIQVAKIGDVPEGTAKLVEIEGCRIALFNSGGQIYALDDTCPHAGASLSEGSFCAESVTCPWHEATFKLADGEVIDGPAPQGVTVYPVRINDSAVEIDVEV